MSSVYTSLAINGVAVAITLSCVLAATKALRQPEPLDLTAIAQNGVSERTVPAALEPLPPLATLDQTLTRPIFEPNRQSQSKREQSAKTVVKAQDIQLRGILVDEQVRSALVWTKKANETKTVHIGDDLSGWRVVDIAPRSMRLERGEDVANLVLAFDNQTVNSSKTSGSQSKRNRRRKKRFDASQFIFDN
ncbi:MAG: hypothetical protein AAF337_07250 [Pseudomonadota bacterium]